MVTLKYMRTMPGSCVVVEKVNKQYWKKKGYIGMIFCDFSEVKTPYYTITETFGNTTFCQ